MSYYHSLNRQLINDSLDVLEEMRGYDERGFEKAARSVGGLTVQHADRGRALEVSLDRTVIGSGAVRYRFSLVTDVGDGTTWVIAADTVDDMMQIEQHNAVNVGPFRKQKAKQAVKEAASQAKIRADELEKFVQFFDALKTIR